MRSIMGMIRGAGWKGLGALRVRDVIIWVLLLLMPIPEAAQKLSISGMAKLKIESRFVEQTARSSAAAKGVRSGLCLSARIRGS